MKKWTPDTARRFLQSAKSNGLTLWSAMDHLRNHHSVMEYKEKRDSLKASKVI